MPEAARREAARRFGEKRRAPREANGGGNRGRQAARGPEQGGDEGLLEAEVAVLEVSVNGKGTTRAWCQDVATGDRVAVFGKGEAGERLRRALRGKVRVAFRALDAGWFAVRVS